MSENEDYVWRKVSGGEVFATPYYRVTLDRVRHPRGHELDYYVVRPRRAAVGIVPVGDDGRVLLVQQYRYTTERLSWEVPAGAMNDGEEPSAAARRELLEETGYEAGEVEPLYRYHPSQGSSSQTFNLFVGRKLTKLGEHDPNEIRQVAWYSHGEIHDLIARNELVDGMSLTALLLYLRLAGGR